MKTLSLLVLSLMLMSTSVFAKKDRDFDARIKAVEERFAKHISFLEESKKLKIDFLTKMKGLDTKLQAATPEEKEAIRKEMKTLRDTHKEQMKSRRAEMKDQIKERRKKS